MSWDGEGDGSLAITLALLGGADFNAQMSAAADETVVAGEAIADVTVEATAASDALGLMLGAAATLTDAMGANTVAVGANTDALAANADAAATAATETTAAATSSKAAMGGMLGAAATLTDALAANTDALAANTDALAANADAAATAATETTAAATSSKAAMGGMLGTMGTASAKTAAAGKAMTRNLTVPLGIIGGAAMVMGTKFETAMEMIHTQAGATQAEVDKMHGPVLKMAQETGTSPEELASGLYHIESIGLRGAKALDALRMSAEGAKIGQADLEETSTALGGVLFVGIKGAGNMQHSMALLNATVGAGNMRMGELVQSLGTGVLPAFKSANLGITDAFGALAVLKDTGYGASSGMAQLSTALHFLTNPGDKAAKALGAIGIEQGQLATDMTKPQGLLLALTDLQDHLKGLSQIQKTQMMGEIVPGGRGRVLLTMIDMLDRYKQKMGQIDAQATPKVFNEAWHRTQQTNAYKMQAAWAGVEGALTKFGQEVGPVLVPVIQDIAGALKDMLGEFDKLSPGQRKAAIKGLLAAFVAGPTVSKVGLLGKGLVALSKGVLMLGGALAWFAGTAAGEAVIGVLESILAAIGAIPAVIAVAVIAVGALAFYVVTHWDMVKQKTEAVWNGVSGVIGGAVATAKMHLSEMGDWFDGIINHMVDAWDSLKFHMPSVDTHIPGVGKIGGFDFGPAAALHITHVGGGPRPAFAGGSPSEILRGPSGNLLSVKPRNYAAASVQPSGMTPGMVNTVVKVGERQIAEATTQYPADRKARR